MSGSYDDQSIRTMEAVFTCSVCGKVAANVTLIPGSVTNPSAMLSERAAGTLMIAGFMGGTGEAVEAEEFMPVKEALLETNAQKLYAIRNLWAPFYCPQCQSVYCLNHWKTRAVFEEGGWYDCSYGVCPQGHERKVDD